MKIGSLFLPLLVIYLLSPNWCFAEEIEQVSLSYGGRHRDYYYHLPARRQHTGLLPVIVALHGGGGNAQHIIRQSELNLLGDRHGVVIVYPEGSGKRWRGKLLATWNAGRCCGYAQDNNVDDVGFITAVLDDLYRRVGYDKGRVYATGMSNGALMAYRLACDAPERFAAIAPVAAHDALLSCNPKLPVAVMHFAGTADSSVPYEGGKCGGRLNAKGWNCRSVTTALAEWVKRNSCDGTMTTRHIGSAICVRHTQCADDATVELCTVNGGGHTWPGSRFKSNRSRLASAMGKIADDVPANTLIWEFFLQHRR